LLRCEIGYREVIIIAYSENINLSVAFLIHGGLFKVFVVKIVNSHISLTYYSRTLGALEYIVLKRGVFAG